MVPWSTIAADPDVQKLNASDYDAVRKDYFDRVIAPTLPTDQIKDVWSDFDSRTGRNFVGDIAAGVKRMGIMSSPEPQALAPQQDMPAGQFDAQSEPPTQAPAPPATQAPALPQAPSPSEPAPAEPVFGQTSLAPIPPETQDARDQNRIKILQNEVRTNPADEGAIGRELATFSQQDQTRAQTPQFHPDADHSAISGMIAQAEHDASRVMPEVDKSNWDKRADGSTKGTGFLGLLKRPDGRVSSEISVGVNIDGKEMEIPSLVPTLSKAEVDHLLSMAPGERMPESIVQKAVEHARARLAAGKNVFADDTESPLVAPVDVHHKAMTPAEAQAFDAENPGLVDTAANAVRGGVSAIDQALKQPHPLAAEQAAAFNADKPIPQLPQDVPLQRPIEERAQNYLKNYSGIDADTARSFAKADMERGQDNSTFRKQDETSTQLGRDLSRGMTGLQNTVDGWRVAEMNSILQARREAKSPTELASDTDYQQTVQAVRQLRRTITERNQEAGRLTQSKAVAKMFDGEGAEGVDNFINGFKDDPKGAVSSIVGSSAVPSAAILAASILARFAGMPVQVAAVSGGGASTFVEFGNDYIQNIEAGQPHDEAYNRALLKAGVIGAFDAASLHAGGHALEEIISGLAKWKHAAAELGKGVATQATLGAGGETLGSVASGSMPQPGQVGAEAAGEIVHGIPEAAGSADFRRSTIKPQAQRDGSVAPAPPARVEPVAGATPDVQDTRPEPTARDLEKQKIAAGRKEPSVQPIDDTVIAENNPGRNEPTLANLRSDSEPGRSLGTGEAGLPAGSGPAGAGTVGTAGRDGENNGAARAPAAGAPASASSTGEVNGQNSAVPDGVREQAGAGLRETGVRSADGPGDESNSGRHATGPRGNSGTGDAGTSAEVKALPSAESILSVDDTVDAAAHEAATSPQNDKVATKDQILAGNAELGHVNIGGLDISVENPAGSIRKDLKNEPPQWQNEMKAHYGYVKGTTASDGDNVDVFIKPGTPTDYNGPVFVVDQKKANGHFDEVKSMIGFPDEAAARAGYLENYSKGWDGIRAVTPMSMDGFKTWLKEGDTKKPAALIKASQKSALNSATPEPIRPTVSSQEGAGVSVAAEQVSRYDGLYGKGMTALNAKVKQKELAKQNPNVDFRVEASPEFGPDRHSVVGYAKPANSATAAPRLSAEASAPKGAPATAEITNEASGVQAAAEPEAKVAGAPISAVPDKLLADAAKKPNGQAAQAEQAKREKATPLSDIRLQNADTVAELKRMPSEAGWAEVGGRMIRGGDGQVTGRTAWVPKADWFKGGLGNQKAITEAVRKAVAGEPMRAAEKRIVGHMLDYLDGSERMQLSKVDTNVLDEAGVLDNQPDENAALNDVLAGTNLIKQSAVESELDRLSIEYGSHDVRSGENTQLRQTESSPKGEGDSAGGDRRQAQAAEGSQEQVQTAEGRQGLDRRADTATRKKVADMSIEEAHAALLTDPLTDLPNRRAFNEAPEKARKASIDIDGLKFVNDTMGHAAGDQFLRNAGLAFQEIEGEIYHVSGDEFIAQADDEATLQDWMARAAKLMENLVVELKRPDGSVITKTGIGFSYGTGDSLAEAETKLQEHKQDRERSGERAPRGERPRGLAEISTTGQPDHFSLESSTQAGLQAAEVKPRPDAPAPEDFTLSGSDRQVDQARAHGQQELIDNPLVSALRTAADAIEKATKPAAATLSSHDELTDRARDGDVTPAELKSGFENLLTGKDAILAELSALKKDDILKRMNAMASYQYKNDKKDKVVQAAYRDLLNDFVLGDSIAYDPMQKNGFENAVRAKVDAYTEADIASYAERVKAARAARAERYAGYKKSLENPETLKEFDTFVELRKDGEAGLTPEQQTRYDELRAEAGRAQRNAPKRTDVVAADEKVGASIVETKHTRDGYDLFVVQLEKRVEREDYNRLINAAKKLGGWYSSFKGNGAVPGFQFKAREAAEAFQKLATEGDTAAVQEVAIERKETRREEKKNAAAERMAEMADKLEAAANESMSRDRLANTDKRARQAASADAEARANIALARTLRNLSDAIESGEAKHLEGIRTKAQIETLDRIATSAKYESLRKQFKDQPGKFEDNKDRPLDVADIHHAKYPTLTGRKEDFLAAAGRFAGKPGSMRLSERFRKMARAVNDDNWHTMGRGIVEEAVEKAGDDYSAVPWHWGENLAKIKRLEAAGIHDEPTLRAALREFVKYRGEKPKADRVKELERALAGNAGVGIDFFPTPEALAMRMAEALGVKAGMTVLEPSAGKGNLADAVRAREPGAEIDTVEQSSNLREILEAKGYPLVGQDFMDFNPEELYDRIIMNPPFSKGMDADHVRKAYDLLKPGGRMVAITGEGIFFRGDQKAKGFRDWFDSVGGESEKLDGAFTDKREVKTTGVNSRLLIVNKPPGEAAMRQSTTSPATAGLSVSEAQAHVDQITEKWKNAPIGGVNVIRSADDLPKNLRDFVSSHGATEGVQAIFDTRNPRVYVIANQVANQSELEFLLFHETLGHFGLRGILDGDRYKITMRQVYNANPAVRATARKLQDQYGYSQDLATEEALADLAAANKEPGIIKQVLAALQRALRKIGLGSVADTLEGMTGAEVAKLLGDARKFVTDGPHAYTSEMQPAMSRAGQRDDIKEPTDTAPGNLYTRIAQKALDSLDRVLDPLGTLPGRDAYLKRRYLALGVIAKGDKVAADIRKMFFTASESDKKASYDYLTTADATPEQIQSAGVRAQAVEVKKLINGTGDEMVKRGLLSEEAREEHKDAYLPRLYLKHLLDEKDFKAMGAGKKPSSMGYLKQRKDIPEEVRRVILGEITEPGFLSAVAVAKPMRDMALLDWMASIAEHGEWILPKSVIDWKGKKVSPYWLQEEATRLRKQAEYYDPKDAVKARELAKEMDTAAESALEGMPAERKAFRQIPNTARHGRLRGVWVRREIYDDISGVNDMLPTDPGFFQSVFGYGGVGTKATQLWKMGKVALNPPAQIRNFVSNAVMLQLSGVPMRMVVPRIVQAWKEIANDGPHWKVAKKYGVTESTFSSQELFRMKRELIDLENQLGKLGPLGKIHRLGAIVAEKASDLYQWSEALFKTAKIIDEMKKGKSEGDAALEAQKWMFDYSLVHKGVRYARNAPIGMPFITYQIKALPRLLEVAALHPQRFAPYAALMYGMAYGLAAALNVDGDDLDKLKKALPEWIRDKGHAMLLPYKDAFNRWQVLDMGYYFPWSYWTELAGNAGRGDVKKTLQSSGAFSGPVPAILNAIATGVDSFTGREIINKGDPTQRQLLSVLNYMWSLSMPPIITEYGAVGHAIQSYQGETNKYGDPRSTYGQAMLRAFGVNIYALEPEQTRAAQLMLMQREIQDTKTRLTMLLQDRGLAKDKERRDALVKTYTDEIKSRTADLKKYQSESEIHPRLK